MKHIKLFEEFEFTPEPSDIENVEKKKKYQYFNKSMIDLLIESGFNVTYDSINLPRAISETDNYIIKIYCDFEDFTENLLIKWNIKDKRIRSIVGKPKTIHKGVEDTGVDRTKDVETLRKVLTIIHGKIIN